MTLLDFVLETLATIFLTVYFLLEGMMKAVLPANFFRKELAGETVLVTGAGSGIGRLMAVKLARLGCKLVLWDINERGNEQTAGEIKEFGGRVFSYKVDLSKRDDVYSAAEKVKSQVGDITILVNNAGIVTGKKFLQCPDALIEKSMEVNAHAHFWTTKAFLPAMMERNHGHIVSIASAAGQVGTVGLADYCASKFAAVGFMESLFLELKAQHKNIHCTTICPYYINTGMFDGCASRFPSILPIQDPEVVVDKIIDAIQMNQIILYTPRVLYLLLALKGIIPVKAAELLMRYFGASSSMDDFKGRQTIKSD